jgi:hypothetical protein
MELIMDCFLFLTSLSIPTLIGKMFLDKVTQGRRHFFFWEGMFISFGLGWGVITLSMFYMSLIRLYFDPAPIALFSLLFCLVILLLPGSRPNDLPCNDAGFKKADRPGTPLALLMMVLAVCAGAGIFFRTMMMIVIDEWDSWAVWGFKAKVYFVDRMIPFDKFSLFKTVWGNWDYPHHVPLMETWVFLCLGYWNDWWARAIFPFFHVGLAVCLYYFFQRYSSRVLSLSGVFFVLTIPHLSAMTMGTIAEPVILFYYIFSFTFLLRWHETRRDMFFLLSAIFAGLAAWTKNEGVAYAIFNLMIILLMTNKMAFSKRSFYVGHYLGIVGIIIGPWWILKFNLGLKNILVNAEGVSRGLLENIFALGPAFKALMAVPFEFEFYNIAWIMFFLFLIFSWKRWSRAFYRFFLFSILFHLFLALGFSVLDPSEQYLRDAFTRLLLAPTILSMMYVILVQGEGADSLSA